MTWELGLRLVGMVICTVLGARLGIQLSDTVGQADLFALVFGLVGSIFGLIVTPYVTTRPARYARRQILTAPSEILVLTLIGLTIGLVLAALLSVPLALLPAPFGQWVPTIVAIMIAYILVTIFATRANDVAGLVARLPARSPTGALPVFGDQGRQTGPQILLDTSVIIDGRVLDICKSGFILGTLIVPRFVLAELQHIADSAEPIKRARGRRGLEVLDQLQKESGVPVRVIDTDVEGVREVDDKLVLLARQMNAQLMTNDFNLNGIAKLQGVPVMNINDLANSVKAVYLPNERITIHVIQEGREPNQGVGYLADGTMVVVEDGKRYMDRTLEVTINRMIQTAAGKMYFAKPSPGP